MLLHLSALRNCDPGRYLEAPLCLGSSHFHHPGEMRKVFKLRDNNRSGVHEGFAHGCGATQTAGEGSSGVSLPGIIREDGGREGVKGGLNPAMQKGDFLLLEIFCCVNTQPSRTRQSGVGGGLFADVALGCFAFGVADHLLIHGRVEKCDVKCFLGCIRAECRRRLSVSPSASLYPLKPVSSVFLHFLPCEEGSNPSLTHARTHAACVRARVFACARALAAR